MDRDIIIVGGGPAGLSTALHLAQDFPHLSSRILILEKARYPRLKLCAGGLVLDAEIILQRLGLDVREVPHADVDQLHFDFEARGLKIHVPKRHVLRVIRRDEFDNWLAQKTKDKGIEIREEITVKNVLPDAHGATIETDQGNFRARVVVGADGSNGITRRCIFPNAPVNTARVLEIVTPVRSEERSRHAYFDFFPVPENIAGYVWDFPTQINGEPMRCWGIYDTNLLAGEKRPQLKEPLAKEMSRFGFNLSDFDVKGHPIRWFSPENPMSIPRVLLVGDSVGADPLFGEGISIALGYGALAAREIGKAIQQNDFSFTGYKRHVLWNAMGRVLIARWLIAYIVYPIKWRWFQILLWWVMKPVVLAVSWLFVLNWGKRL